MTHNKRRELIDPKYYKFVFAQAQNIILEVIYIDSNILLLMMMMNQTSMFNKQGAYELQLQNYNGDTKTLQFNSLEDLRVFLETDFEITDYKVKEEELPAFRSIIQNQNEFDVHRNVLIKLDSVIGEGRFEIPENPYGDYNPYNDFNPTFERSEPIQT